MHTNTYIGEVSERERERERKKERERLAHIDTLIADLNRSVSTGQLSFSSGIANV